jgi:hypothetical protein
MGQNNGNRGAQRGINAGARRATASRNAANANPGSAAAQAAANRDGDNLQAQRDNRRHRGA